MLQILQHQKTGKLFVAELPSPQLQPGGVLVRNVASVISAGTERSSVQTAEASLLGKARSRPDLVRQVLDNVKREGIFPTYKKVQSRLDNYKELGYSSAGIVVESTVPSFRTGERVACAGVAYHAEEIVVPKNLAVRIPDQVSFEEAAFTTLGAIALQGVRQADSRLGETVAVIGIGLLGLLTVQLLRAAGCRVLALDVSETNFTLAKSFGCDAVLVSREDAVSAVVELTRGRGADAVILTASTKSNEPISLAMRMARKRARIVIVGAVGLEIERSTFYEKELDLRISCSYGPGRYDPVYEIEGHDYPIGYVRWTENRNMEAVLDLMAQKKLDCLSLISHRFPISDALQAYAMVTGKSREKALAVVLQYPGWEASETKQKQAVSPESLTQVRVESRVRGIGFVGAGNFAQSHLLPHLVEQGVILTGVATITPAHALKVKEKFRFSFSSTDPLSVLGNADTRAVFIATRHDSHASLVREALERGKHVFVEKPLATSHEQLDMIIETWNHTGGNGVLMTGFNRRFSKPWRDIQAWFVGNVEPYIMLYRVNAGSLPEKHWLRSPDQGGRIIGEVCHFIDCMQFITKSLPTRVYAEGRGDKQGRWLHGDDVTISITFADGSVGTIVYVASSDASLEKEYCEIHSAGKTAIMNNFRDVVFIQDRKKMRRRYDGTKGHREEVQHFLELTEGSVAPLLPLDAQFAVTRATLQAVESLKNRCAVDV